MFLRQSIGIGGKEKNQHPASKAILLSPHWALETYKIPLFIHCNKGQETFRRFLTVNQQVFVAQLSRFFVRCRTVTDFSGWSLESELLRYIGRRRQHSINVPSLGPAPSPRDVMLNMSASSKSVRRWWSRARLELRRYMHALTESVWNGATWPFQTLVLSSRSSWNSGEAGCNYQRLIA